MPESVEFDPRRKAFVVVKGDWSNQPTIAEDMEQSMHHLSLDPAKIRPSRSIGEQTNRGRATRGVLT
jgi:hypothetical protein